MSMAHIRSLATLTFAVIAFSGQLLDQTTGQPLTHVTVAVSGPANAKATTDAQGRFSFKSLKPGAYTVTADSDDVPPQTFHVTVKRNQSASLTVKLCSTTLDYHCGAPNN
jgi:protocatechuate 3,4-dioxygenase beta subunit